MERFDAIELPGANAQVPDIRTASLDKQPGEGFAALGAESADLYVAAVVRGPRSAMDRTFANRMPPLALTPWIDDSPSSFSPISPA